MNRRKAVSMIGALVLTISAAAVITGCQHPDNTPGIPEKQAIFKLPFGATTLTLTADTVNEEPITVEGCTVATLASGPETTLYASGDTVVLKGDIKTLTCDKNELMSLDVSGLANLITLDCSLSKLYSLNVRGLTNLEKLTCDYNRLANLDVQGLTKLQELKCSYNFLRNLDVRGSADLKTLECKNNELRKLVVHGLAKLETIACNDNNLTGLNLQGLTNLIALSCNNNGLTNLDVQGLSMLENLDCHRNRLPKTVFTKLFTDLPRRTHPAGYLLLYTEQTGVAESNYKAPASELDGIRAKNWSVNKLNAGGIPEAL
ncbi:MAG: leucine-rich repeat domain-containing protein [Treponema maltophilum]